MTGSPANHCFGYDIVEVFEAVAGVTSHLDEGMLTEEFVRDRFARATLAAILEPGDEAAGKAVHAVGVERMMEYATESVDAETISDETGLTLAKAERLALHMNQRQFVDGLGVLRDAREAGMNVLGPGEKSWPKTFEVMGDQQPFALFAKGDMSVLERLNTTNSVSVGGARASTRYGEQITTEIAEELAIQNTTVVTGGGYGVEGEATRAALIAGGTPVVFLAGGVDRGYPSAHSGLFNRVADRGVVVSENAPGASPTKWRFMRRNSLVGAVSQVTLITEAGRNSGSLATATAAKRFGRTVAAVPGPVTSIASEGANMLIRERVAELVSSAEDVRQLLER